MIARTPALMIGIWVSLLMAQAFGANQQKKAVKELLYEYSQAKNEPDRIQVLKELHDAEPRTPEDANVIKSVLTRKEWDEELFHAALKSLSRIREPGLDAAVIEVLRADRDYLGKAVAGDLQGRSEREILFRSWNAEVAIRKLGELKSADAVPVLREYLNIKGLGYPASEALAKIGDVTSKEEIKERAYRGEEINYGGAGEKEALNVIRDLQDKGKSDKWPKIAKQLILINHPAAKPHLKALLDHEKDYVRQETATVFLNMAGMSDVPSVLEMAGHQDWFVRSSAIRSMQRIHDPSFEKMLIDLLINDPHGSPRANAAKALGYKKCGKAVPYLEKALKDKDESVRSEAFVALYIITGNKYDFAGRNHAIDQHAERHPGFRDPAPPPYLDVKGEPDKGGKGSKTAATRPRRKDPHLRQQRRGPYSGPSPRSGHALV